MRHLTDLDELLEKVRSSYSREYLGEAVTTYRAGAYRAAVAITWVAVCIDILDKIRELSEGGNKKANELEGKRNELSENKQELQKFERDLLEEAKNLEVISSVEYSQLKRIKEDRNLCVHPTFQKEGNHVSISAEIARAHIVAACTCLLINAPIQGKELIEKVLNRIQEKSFPLDKETARTVLSSEYYLGRAQEPVYKNLCILILKDIFSSDESILSDRLDRYAVALYAMEKLQSQILKKTLNEKLNLMLVHCSDDKFSQIFILLKSCSFIWSRLNEVSQVRLFGLISNGSLRNIMLKWQIPELANSNKNIQDAFLERFENFTHNELLEIVNNFPNKLFKDFSIEQFIESGNFASAHSNGRAYLLPHAEYLTEKDLEKILQGSLDNDQIINAGRMDSIFTQLYESTKKEVINNTIWENFYSKLNNKDSFPVLTALLGLDGIIHVSAETQLVDSLHNP